MYLFTIPSNNSIRHLSPIISEKLHLFPFPPRYLPYEDKESIIHSIDQFTFSCRSPSLSSLLSSTISSSIRSRISLSGMLPFKLFPFQETVSSSRRSLINNKKDCKPNGHTKHYEHIMNDHDEYIDNNTDSNMSTNTWEKLKYTWTIFSLTIAYQVDSKFWKVATELEDELNGKNPYLSEKWLWEGIVDILKSRSNYLEDDKRGIRMNSKFSHQVNNSSMSIDDNDELNLFEGWEVVYERIGM